MQKLDTITLKDVQKVYAGAEGKLWELIMGEQVHIGGLVSSMDLANRAGIGAGMRGVDLCCCSGGGMRFLVRFRDVAFVHGVDATAEMVELGRTRAAKCGLHDRIAFTLGDACATGLPDASADFVWGEDAWCYVNDKAALVAEAARLVRKGGVIAFTDWVEGPQALSPAEAKRYQAFMKFPSIATAAEYSAMLAAGGCQVLHAADTGRFADHVELYIKMLGMQLTSDALAIVGYDQAVMKALADEMIFVFELARACKISQAMLVARKV